MSLRTDRDWVNDTVRFVGARRRGMAGWAGRCPTCRVRGGCCLPSWWRRWPVSMSISSAFVPGVRCGSPTSGAQSGSPVKATPEARSDRPAGGVAAAADRRAVRSTGRPQGPRNKATVILVIDVSRSMNATDVAPSRIKAAQAAAKEVRRRTDRGHQPGADLVCGHRVDAGVADPRPHGHQGRRRQTTTGRNKTATGEGIFAAIQQIQTLNTVLGGDKAARRPASCSCPTARETVPDNPNNPRGAFTAARKARRRRSPYRRSPSARWAAPSISKATRSLSRRRRVVAQDRQYQRRRVLHRRQPRRTQPGVRAAEGHRL